MNDAAAQAPVLFEERPAANGKRIGFATLNSPRTLNGLSLDMALLLDERLQAWARDGGIAMVVLQGAGDKAFCAGGDLHSLYRSMQEVRAAGQRGMGDIRANAYAARFFAVEYRLDYRLHTYPKPVLCWGHGVVMGGGLGLMAGSSHRVVTERTRLAFPEISVGLFPDVGGSWLLRRVPDEGGLFLALTGAPLNAGDAMHARLADWHVPESGRAALYQALEQAPWDAENNGPVLTAVLRQHARDPAAGPLRTHRALIAAICKQGDLLQVAGAIEAMTTADAWLAAAKSALAGGSPGSIRLAFELHRRAAHLSLADVFRMEYLVALHCCAHGDFEEGIRALLIDKDRQPRWNPATLAAATQAWSDKFFTAPWSAAEHPLADLGAGGRPE